MDRAVNFENHYDAARVRGDWEEARHWLQQGARAGDPFSCGQLGVWHLLGHVVNRNDRTGFQLVRGAARAGLPEARRLIATLYALGRGVKPNWEQAVDWLVRGARSGDPDPARQLAFLLPAALAGERRALLESAAKSGDVIAQRRLQRDGKVNAAPRMDWRRIRQGAARPARVRGAIKAVSESPKLHQREAALSPDVCDYLICIAAPFLSRARVNDPVRGTELVDDSRTNSFATLSLVESDVVTTGIDFMLARLLGQTPKNAEPASVLHYSPGEQFAPHFDFFDPKAPVHAAQIAAAGQRVMTCLVYLNNDYEGGATRFLDTGFEFRGEAGTALFWRNTDANGLPDRSTLHAGLPPTAGEKWLLSKWFRDRPYTQVRTATMVG